jgi:putative endonuclease
MRRNYLYILASKKQGTLYIGVTSNLARRVYEHKINIVPGFSSKYKTSVLVHIEEYSLMTDAIAREKTLKKWNRSWKIKLIDDHNPEWNDLSQYLLSQEE